MCVVLQCASFRVSEPDRTESGVQLAPISQARTLAWLSVCLSSYFCYSFVQCFDTCSLLLLLLLLIRPFFLHPDLCFVFLLLFLALAFAYLTA